MRWPRAVIHVDMNAFFAAIEQRDFPALHARPVAVTNGTLGACIITCSYTATGRYLLIPQGARLIGHYDNGVSMGQSRVLVAWNRIIYPDGSSLDLGKMPGADPSGYAGFEDLVNNHYWKVFGNALLLSVFAAGIQLSQPQAQNGENPRPRRGF